MGMTMIENILARQAGRDRVTTDDIVICDVNMAVLIDISFLIDAALSSPKKITDPDRIAVIFDHRVPAPTIESAIGHIRGRKFVEKWGIKRFFDVGNHGICHQVIQENALALPGQILTCSDSHTIGSGALNCAARGLGALDFATVMCTGKTWFRVPPVINIVLEGAKPPNVFGKDIILHIAGILGSVEGHGVEFTGSGLGSLSIDDRTSLTTMCSEISAEFALMPADEVVLRYLRERTSTRLEPVIADSSAKYSAVHVVDLGKLGPVLARPDFIPKNTEPVTSLAERVKIDQAFVGSCANGKLEDFRAVAAVLKGRTVAPGVRLIVTPASQQVYLAAVQAGYVETLIKAGAVVTNSTCGACAGGHMGVLGPGEVCITSSTRNFRGRMGSPEATIYMGSSATVAASAVTGYITDPTPFLN